MNPLLWSALFCNITCRLHHDRVSLRPSTSAPNQVKHSSMWAGITCQACPVGCCCFLLFLCWDQSNLMHAVNHQVCGTYAGMYVPCAQEQQWLRQVLRVCAAPVYMQCTAAQPSAPILGRVARLHCSAGLAVLSMQCWCLSTHHFVRAGLAYVFASGYVWSVRLA